MGFPLVIGAKSISSRPVALAEPVEEFADDGIRVLRPSMPTAPTVIVAASPGHELLAIVTLSYYEMVCEEMDEIEYCVAELRVQIARSTDTATMDTRDSVHRIRLAYTGSKDAARPLDESASQAQVTRMAIVSPDLRFLTCLIPHPVGAGSTVTVLQLRKARDSGKQPNLPPLPSYIPAPKTPVEATVLVATNPRVLVRHKNEATGVVDPLLDVTSVVNFGTTMLLLGTVNGSVLLASYRPPLLHGLLLQLAAIGDDGDLLAIDRPVTAMDHFADYDDAVESRLAVLGGNRTIDVFGTYMDSVASTSDEELLQKDDPSRLLVSELAFCDSENRETKVRVTHTHRIQSEGNSPAPSFACIKWIADSYLAALQQPDTTCTTSVYALYNQGRSSAVYSTVMSTSRLEEHALTDFAVAVDSPSLANGHHHEPRLAPGKAQHSLLEYDRYSDSLAISSFLLNQDTQTRRPFVCLWNWRTNSQSFCTKSATHVGTDSICLSSAFFACDETKKRKLVHVVAFAAPRCGPLRVRKEGYELALASPPNQAAHCGGRIEQASTLLLGATSVSYPRRERVSARENFEVLWSESTIPNPYIAAHGAPVMAAMGNLNGRAVAIASSKGGLCILGGLGFDQRYPGLSSLQYECGSNQSDLRQTSLLQRGFTFPRWYMFGNETEEHAFQVVAMKWWEGMSPNGDVGTRFADDLLVTVIKTVGDQRYHLACWSCRTIEQSRQLLRSLPIGTAQPSVERWGVPLPKDFCPSSLDVLACPDVSGGSTLDPLSRKACVLVTDRSSSTRYQVFQLQVMDATNHAPEINRYVIHARLSASGMIGAPAQLFLAGASYAFDFGGAMNELRNEKASIAVIGVVRMHGGGLDAISIQSSSVVAVGQVIETAADDFENFTESELSRLWLADCTPNRPFADNGMTIDFFVWVIQLASGRLVSWSVPFVTSMDRLPLMVEPTQTLNYGEATVGIYTVHTKGISLGIVCPAGTTSSWMTQSSSGTRDDFIAGQVPRAEFGYAVGVSQGCKKLHRSTGSDFERELFRKDCFDHDVYRSDDFVLYPPISLPSMFSLLLGTLSATNLGQSHLDRCIHRRTTAREVQSSTSMSLQLMTIRAAEKFAAISKQRSKDVTLKRSLVAGMLTNLVDAVRRNTTRLQFATLFLKVARQIEPSCLPYLFPLPSSSRSTLRETADDLFDMALELGSIDTSVATLPLLADGETTKTMCVAIFQFCLSAMEDCTGRGAMEFTFDVEKRTTLVDVFRYALKLTGARDVPADDTDLSREKGYSIMCGVVPSVFGRGHAPKKADNKPMLINSGYEQTRARKQLGYWNVEALSGWRHYRHFKFKTVAAVVARFMVSSLFEAHGHLSRTTWQKIGSLGVLLICDSRTDFQSCNTVEFSRLLESTASTRYAALIPQDERQTGKLPAFLHECMQRCDESLDPYATASLLDLLLVLLACDTSDFHADIPGLLLTSIVAAHVSGRISELSPDNDGQGALWNAYRKGLLQQDE